jgi:16S rRNA (guanine527-N7)-methyltransferase
VSLEADATALAVLRNGLEELDLLAALGEDEATREEKLQQLIRYRDLIQQWNQVYNLTAVRNPQEMIARHLLDSLSVLPDVLGPRVLDLGTGAGLPGIPWAIVRPDWEITLLDSQAKRVRFLRQVVLELRLRNATVVHSRAQDFSPSDALFNTVTSRAFTDFPAFCGMAKPLCASGGRVVAMKGQWPEPEASVLTDLALQVRAVQVPGTTGARHVVRADC